MNFSEYNFLSRLLTGFCLERLGLELGLLEALRLPCARGSRNLLDEQPFDVDGSQFTVGVLFLVDVACFRAIVHAKVFLGLYIRNVSHIFRILSLRLFYFS